MRPDLCGEDFSTSSLRAESSRQSKRGRPPEISPEKLRRNVIELSFALEENWGEVGWLLWKAAGIADVQCAFRHIVNPRCSLLEPFTNDAPRPTTSNRLRKLRRRVTESIQRHRERFKSRQNAYDACERAFNAWVAEANPVRRAQIQMICPSLARDYEEAEALEKTSRLERDSLQVELKEQEAYFAQSEILKSIQSKRYEYTPSNVACAMAGLPFVTARVSFIQCSNHGIDPLAGTAFNIFKIIERAVRTPIVDLPGFLNSLREYLLSVEKHPPAHVAELRRNWYYLESAVKSAARDKHASLDSLPFLIFAEYTRALSSQSAADSVLADAQRLFVPGEEAEPHTGTDWGQPRKH